MRYFCAFHALLNLSICDDVRHQTTGSVSIEEFCQTKTIRSGTVVKIGDIFLEICLAINDLFEEGLGDTHLPLRKLFGGAFIW